MCVGRVGEVGFARWERFSDWIACIASVLRILPFRSGPRCPRETQRMVGWRWLTAAAVVGGKSMGL